MRILLTDEERLIRKRQSSSKYYAKKYANNKESENERSRIYCSNNREKQKERGKKYYEDNKEVISERIKKSKKDNKEETSKKRKIYLTKRFESNPIYKLTELIRTLIRNSVIRQGYTKKSKTNKILGCSFEEFREHLEIQFIEGMTWDNHGEWHMDHIKPISLAKTEEEVYELNHYTNFQPLWAVDNWAKGNKYI